MGYVKKCLGELKAKKKYGQNFLIDNNVVDKIAKESCDKQLRTIEIGPGIGALTEMLLKYSLKVTAYEIDKDLYQILKDTFVNEERLELFLQDFLKLDFKQIPYLNEKIVVCANLPYYITTPILFKLIESGLDFKNITVMVQKEMADRFKAQVNDENYNALTVIINYLFDVRHVMDVSRKVFYPSPNVDSSVISFVPKIERNKEFEKEFFDFVEKCFVQRRKTLKNNLKEFLNQEVIEQIYQSMNLKENIRAQELSVIDYLKMYEVSHV